ncbi:MAG TPA: cytochrome c oxidase assembly protein [Caldilineaceae bacterium]|nr:cytochrome c oxidase assembly protein [Caldilineaceae bacterium]
MFSTPLVWQLGAGLLLALLAALYLRGWRRLRRVEPRLANVARLLAFLAGLTALALALIWPLPIWSNQLLTMRSVQKALVAMIAPPLLWLGCPVHVIVWGLRRWLRHSFVYLRQGHGLAAQGLRRTTQPLVGWFAFVGAFLFWHDPQSAPFLLGDTMLHYLAPWLLLGAALLYWWPVVGSGPRIHNRFPAWVLIPYLITVEIPNMVAGVTIAFSSQPIYPYYAAVHAQAGDRLRLDVMNDQMVGGAIVWVFGSLVYVTSIVLVVHRLFRSDGATAPQPPPNWDADEKFIAPGLEHRARQNALRKVDLRHR